MCGRDQCSPVGEGNNGFMMGTPGTLHHTWFLDSCLYIIQFALLADNLPPGLVTPNMSPKIDRMLLCISTFHRPWYLQATSEPAVPRLDLEMWQNMDVGNEVQMSAINSAMKSMNLSNSDANI